MKLRKKLGLEGIHLTTTYPVESLKSINIKFVIFMDIFSKFQQWIMGVFFDEINCPGEIIIIVLQ